MASDLEQRVTALEAKLAVDPDVSIKLRGIPGLVVIGLAGLIGLIWACR